MLLVFVAASLGGAASLRAGTFYAELVRPAWAPPAWLFGPVWSALYVAMGLAAWRVWRLRGLAEAKLPLALFVAQLGVNALWTWLFFAWREGGLAFAEILLLWGLLFATIVQFWRIDKPAAGLLVPYLLWVSFATVLNWAVWRLNPLALGG